MTRSEAAKICQSIKFMMDKDDYSEEVEEALDMAMEALVQEETLQNLTKPNKRTDKHTETHACDLISRQAAVDAFDGVKVDEKTEYDIGYNDGIDFAVSKLSVLPSAQPFTSEQIQTMQELEAAQVEKAYELGKADRPTGEWIKNEGMAPPEFTGRYVCSICGDYALMSMPYGSKQELSNFCPNCGTDMRGEQE